jgi:hypothetical protein
MGGAGSRLQLEAGMCEAELEMRHLVGMVGGEEIRLSAHQEVKKQQELEDASFSQPRGEEATAAEDAPAAASCRGCSRGLLRSSSPRRCQGPTNRRRRRDAVAGPLAAASSSASHGRWELLRRIFKRDARHEENLRVRETGSGLPKVVDKVFFYFVYFLLNNFALVPGIFSRPSNSVTASRDPRTNKKHFFLAGLFSV